MQLLGVCSFSVLVIMVYTAAVPNHSSTSSEIAAMLEKELRAASKHRTARQQDEVITDVIPKGGQKLPNRRKSKTRDTGEEEQWTLEDVEKLYLGLPEKDKTIIKEFADLTERLNYARQIVLLEEQLRRSQEKEENIQSRTDQKQAPSDETQGQWLDKPFSEQEIDRAKAKEDVLTALLLLKEKEEGRTKAR